MTSKAVFFTIIFLVSLSLLFILPKTFTGFFITTEKPLASSSIDAVETEIPSPSDRITENQIEIREDKIIIHISNTQLSRYANTNSMDPTIDKNANGIEIIPESEEDIHIGDIITYEQDNTLIVHRVIDIGEDNHGKYYLVKGDNNQQPDTKIRFEQIRYITIGILY